jgi:Family of unknown function (DUF6627)
MRIPLMKYIASYLAFAMFILGIVPRVDAGFVPSEIITHPQIDRTVDLQKIQKVLETKMVRERLENLGFTEDEIQRRLSQLSDEQIHNLALKLDQLRVGGYIDGPTAQLLFEATCIVVGLIVYGFIYLIKIVTGDKDIGESSIEKEKGEDVLSH